MTNRIVETHAKFILLDVLQEREKYVGDLIEYTFKCWLGFGLIKTNFYETCSDERQD